jgi:thymidylate kinase
MIYPLIAIDGGDAAGKATLTRGLAALLAAHYSAEYGEPIECATFSLPAYDAPTGEVLRRHLRGEWSVGGSSGEDMIVRQALMTHNRVEIQREIVEALRRGPVVLDRWYGASIAYGVAEGLDPSYLYRISAPLLRPSLWIYLDVDPREAAKRREAPRDLNESDFAKLDRARAAYREHMGKHPLLSPCFTVDAARTADEVLSIVWAHVEDRIRVGALDAPRGGAF